MAAAAPLTAPLNSDSSLESQGLPQIIDLHERNMHDPNKFIRHRKRAPELSAQGQHPKMMVIAPITRGDPENIFNTDTGKMFLFNSQATEINYDDTPLFATYEYWRHLEHKFQESLHTKTEPLSAGEIRKKDRQTMVLIINNTSALKRTAEIILDPDRLAIDKNKKSDYLKLQKCYFESAPLACDSLCKDKRELNDKLLDFCNAYLKEQADRFYNHPDVKKDVDSGKVAIVCCLENLTDTKNPKLEEVYVKNGLTLSGDPKDNKLPEMYTNNIKDHYKFEPYDETVQTVLNVTCSDSRIPVSFHGNHLLQRLPGSHFLLYLEQLHKVLVQHPEISEVNVISHTDCGAAKALFTDRDELRKELPIVANFLDEIKKILDEKFLEMPKFYLDEKDPKHKDAVKYVANHNKYNSTLLAMKELKEKQTKASPETIRQQTNLAIKDITDAMRECEIIIAKHYLEENHPSVKVIYGHEMNIASCELHSEGATSLKGFDADSEKMQEQVLNKIPERNTPGLEVVVRAAAAARDDLHRNIRMVPEPLKTDQVSPRDLIDQNASQGSYLDPKLDPSGCISTGYSSSPT